MLDPRPIVGPPAPSVHALNACWAALRWASGDTANARQKGLRAVDDGVAAIKQALAPGGVAAVTFIHPGSGDTEALSVEPDDQDASAWRYPGCYSYRRPAIARYAGVEPERWLIDQAVEHEIGQSMIAIKRPRFDSSSDFSFEHLGRFEFVLAQGVATNTGPTLLSALLSTR